MNRAHRRYGTPHHAHTAPVDYLPDVCRWTRGLQEQQARRGGAPSHHARGVLRQRARELLQPARGVRLAERRAGAELRRQHADAVSGVGAAGHRRRRRVRRRACQTLSGRPPRECLPGPARVEVPGRRGLPAHRERRQFLQERHGLPGWLLPARGTAGVLRLQPVHSVPARGRNLRGVREVRPAEHVLRDGRSLGRAAVPAAARDGRAVRVP